MNRAPEETINRKSPSKHALTGMVGAVTTIRGTGTHGTGTQRGPVRCPYGLHTGKGAGHVPCPHRALYSARTVDRMGPVPFCPYRSHTVLPVPVPYRFACMGPVPFYPYGPRNVLPLPVPYRFARTGPAPFFPYPYRTVLPVPVPYRFARTGPVPFCPHVALMLPLNGAGFSSRGCLNQAAPPLSLLSYV